MNIYLLLIISIILLFMAGYAFYIVIKKYEEDDDFTGGISTFTIVEFILSMILIVSEKLFPKKYHIVIFKVFSLLFGIFMLGLAILLWVLFF
jgi:hypothetical protein